MRERERKERGEIQNEGRCGRKGIEWKKGVGDRKKNGFFLELLFNFFDKTVTRSPPNEASLFQ
jgi:hypothetical protein